MKNYVKPDVFVTEFQVNEAVAYCDPTNVYNEVTVNCVITGSHDIFYDLCDSNYNNCLIITYNGGEYLVWANTSGGGAGSGSRKGGGGTGGTGGGMDSSLLEAILDAGVAQGKISAGYNWSDYHAGLITPDITSVRNQST